MKILQAKLHEHAYDNASRYASMIQRRITTLMWEVVKVYMNMELNGLL